jgi:hypothetical protein
MFDIKLNQIFAILKNLQLYRFVTKSLTWSSTYTNVHSIRCIVTISSIANATNIHKGVHQISFRFMGTGHHQQRNNELCS